MKKKSEITYEDIKGYVHRYITDKDCQDVMGARRYKRFIDFMTGQTCPLEGYYPWDVENFFRKEEGRGYFWD